MSICPDFQSSEALVRIMKPVNFKYMAINGLIYYRTICILCKLLFRENWRYSIFFPSFFYLTFEEMKIFKIS